MEPNNKYNGWANRETWLVNVWHGNDLYDIAEDMLREKTDYTGKMEGHWERTDFYYELSSRYEEWIADVLAEQVKRNACLAVDLIRNSEINFMDLAETLGHDAAQGLDYQFDGEEPATTDTAAGGIS